MTLADRLQRDWWLRRPTALALALTPLAGLYALLSGLHRAAFRQGWRVAETAPVPVVVVGNLIVGGAGKTPTVIALVNALRAAGWMPGVISRGYGRAGEDVQPVSHESSAEAVGDEPLLIHLRTQAPVCVARDRVAAARQLCARHPEVNVIVSDDGLQHLRLARSFELWVFDDRGAGNGLLLPAGPLRQPLPRQVPANASVLYNAPAPSTGLPGETAFRRLGGAVPLSGWWQGQAADRSTLAALGGREVWAAAGMANPERFFRMLEAEGLHLKRCPLPDHHPFRTLPWPDDTIDVLVTEKDAVKLRPEHMGRARVWVVTLDFALPPTLLATLSRHLPAPARLPASS